MATQTMIFVEHHRLIAKEIARALEHDGHVGRKFFNFTPMIKESRELLVRRRYAPINQGRI